jgi:ribosomal-protein-alanine N-acetyltransferase
VGRTTPQDGRGAPGVPAIATPRLDLVSLSPGAIDALLDGALDRAGALLGAAVSEEWVAASRRPLRYRQQQLRGDPALQPWLLRAMVLRRPAPAVIGHIGFHDAPDARGALEVGYAVLPAYRRRGYAEEAVRSLFDWARREHGVRRFIASVSPGNAASRGLVGKLGFRQTGSQMDEEDGEELVFELDLDSGAPPAVRDRRP